MYDKETIFNKIWDQIHIVGFALLIFVALSQMSFSKPIDFKIDYDALQDGYDEQVEKDRKANEEERYWQEQEELRREREKLEEERAEYRRQRERAEKELAEREFADRYNH